MSGSSIDLVIRGGRVIDPLSGLDKIADVAIRDGRIVSIESNGDNPGGQESIGWPSVSTQEIDATGQLVVPGFVDLHAHVYTGVCPLTVPADAACAQGGVTTVVSAGDAGANTIGGFRQLVVDRSLTRVLAFLHISRIGLVGWPVAEAVEVDHLDVDAAVRAAAMNRDIVVGVKVRMSASATGTNGMLPLKRAVAVGEAAGIPVMVHIGEAGFGLMRLLEVMRPGDIVTHSFTAARDGIVENGNLVYAARVAQQRGVLFDVGHGFGSFDFPTAELCARHGFFPETISTDIHSLSARAHVDLPSTMTKMLHLGMPLVDVLASVTSRPAAAIGRAADCGQLQIGSVADLAIIGLATGSFRLRDSGGNERYAKVRFELRNTIRAGQPWYGCLRTPRTVLHSPPAIG